MKIAIIGRPNVGKSSLFNRICKKRISIIDEEEGVTRDRIYQRVSFFGKEFDLIDTGGMDFSKKDFFSKNILKQSQKAIEDADFIIMMVDGTVGILDLDLKIRDLLVKNKKPFILAVNKIDDFDKDHLIHEFYPLKIEKMIGISALHGRNIETLFENIFIKDTTIEKNLEKRLEKKEGVRVSIIGRANVGKSTLFNSLIKKERSLISSIAGTTRDSIEERKDKYILVDTAGIRRRHKEKISIEKFAYMRTMDAIKRSDICILVIDVKDKMTTQDKRILKEIEKNGKGCILFVNKIDLKKAELENSIKYPLILGSAKTGKNVDNLWRLLKDMEKRYMKKITTSELNKFIKKCMDKYSPIAVRGKRLKIYYLTQIGIKPPKFCLFVNQKFLLTKGYEKYLLNQFCKYFQFDGIPIFFEKKQKADYFFKRDC